jgi:hypothetical protein
VIPLQGRPILPKAPRFSGVHAHVSQQTPSASSTDASSWLQTKTGGAQSAFEMRRAPWIARAVQERRLLPVYSMVSDESCVRKRYWIVEAEGVERQASEKGVRVV